MSVSTEVQEFIYTSLAENNKSLLDQISKLVADSAESIKRSSVEAADDQLREIKKLRREEPKSFKRKGNEIQYKFNLKLQDTLDEVKSDLESTAVYKAKSSLSEGTSMLSERQKLILLADKSDFGWKTVEQYTQHELADNEEDGKKIRRAEERAEKALKSHASKKPINQSSSLSRLSSSSRFSSQYSRSSSSFGSFRNQRLRPSYPRPSDVPSRPGNRFACGRFGHWRSECNQVARSVSKGISDDKTVTNKISLNFHFLLPRVTSLKIYQRIPLKNLRALSLSLRSQLLVLLLSNQCLLKVNCLDPFSIGNLLVRRILYYLSSEMATKSLLFPRRRLAVSRTMPQPLSRSRFC